MSGNRLGAFIQESQNLTNASNDAFQSLKILRLDRLEAGNSPFLSIFIFF